MAQQTQALHFLIKSDSTDATYTTTLDSDGFRLGCTCPAGQNNIPCKHLFRAQVKMTDAFVKARKNLLSTEFKSKREFARHFSDLAGEIGVNDAIKDILDRGLPAEDTLRVVHSVGDWTGLLKREVA